MIIMIIIIMIIIIAKSWILRFSYCKDIAQPVSQAGEDTVDRDTVGGNRSIDNPSSNFSLT